MRTPGVQGALHSHEPESAPTTRRREEALWRPSLTESRDSRDQQAFPNDWNELEQAYDRGVSAALTPADLGFACAQGPRVSPIDIKLKRNANAAKHMAPSRTTCL